MSPESASLEPPPSSPPRSPTPSPPPPPPTNCTKIGHNTAECIETRMTTQYDYGYGRRSSSGGFFIFLLALVLGAAAMAVFVRHATAGFLARVADKITGRQTTYDTSVPAVVQRIRRLNRLETVVYSIDTVVEGSKTSDVLPDVLAGD